MKHTSAPQRSSIVVGIAIVLSDGKVLVGKRSSDAHLPGFSEFPGGKCHHGESAAACAIRECLEETGMRIDIQESLSRSTHSYSDRDVDLSFFLCQLIDPIDETSIAEPFEWFPIDQLQELTFPDGNRAVLQILQDRFGSGTTNRLA